MNNRNYPDNILLPDSGGLVSIENYSGSTSSAYDEVSPHMHNSTPCSNDSNYDKNNPSTISSKISKNSQISHEDNPNLTVDALEKTLTEDKTSKIKDIIALITNLSDTEKLLLQLQFPLTDNDNMTFESNNLDLMGNFSQNEHSEALTWVISHLEEYKSTCLQKQEVYEDYKTYCVSHNIKCLSTADFGKVIKKVFPNIKARRLGARGQSRYCYSGLRNRHEIQSPMLVDVTINLENSENTNDDRKRDNNTNSEVESYSSASVQNDLSHVPEYELGPNIIVDSALVILDFIKKVALNKNVMSLKQAVRQLLISNQVETRSPHALRLLTIFQQMDGQKSYPNKKSTIDSVCHTVKKEETLSTSCNGTPQRSSTTSPQKRRNVESPPIHNKVQVFSNYQKNQALHSSINTPQNCINMQNTFDPQYYSHNLPTMHHATNLGLNNLRHDMISASIPNTPNSKPFIPQNSSTPLKNSPMMETLQLNSSLLENNPSTTKKLDMSNSKLYINNNSICYSDIPDVNIPRGVKQEVYEQYYSQQPFLQMRQTPSTNTIDTDDFRDTVSPIAINQRYRSDNIDSSNDFSSEIIRRSLLVKRRIDGDFSDNVYGCSPRIDVYGNYSTHNSEFDSLQSTNSTAKTYLNTPGNSPNPNDLDLTEYSGRTSVSLKRESYPVDKSNYKPVNSWSSANSNILQVGLCDTAMNQNRSNFRSLTGRNDEFFVSSTTNPGLLDQNVHLSSTTMQQQSLFN